MDTIVGTGDQHCVVTLVERATGSVLLGKVPSRKAAGVTRKVIELIDAHPQLFKTITADNGTEFHSYREIEEATGGDHLLRHSVPLLGTRHQRKHEWLDSSVPAETHIDAHGHAVSMQRRSSSAEQPAAQAPISISNAVRTAATTFRDRHRSPICFAYRQRCSSKLKLRGQRGCRTGGAPTEHPVAAARTTAEAARSTGQ